MDVVKNAVGRVAAYGERDIASPVKLSTPLPILLLIIFADHCRAKLVSDTAANVANIAAD